MTPTYEPGCKRLLIANDWYPALVRDDVDVVTSAIAEIVPEGVRTADGGLHELDTLVLGAFAAMLLGLLAHGLGRFLTRGKRPKNAQKPNADPSQNGDRHD